MASIRRKLEYRVDQQNDMIELQSELNQYALCGWSLHSIFVVNGNVMTVYERSCIGAEETDGDA